MKNAISVLDIFATIKKRWKLIMLTTSVALIISIIISFFVMTPVYQASTEILVNQKDSENKLDITLMQSNVDLINTYSMIIKSPVILDKVIESLNLTLTEEQLNEKIAINSSENSQVFSIIVEDTNSVRAVEIANSTSETFQKEIKGIMKVDNVSILAQAEIKENPTPIKPNRLLNSTIAIVVGVMAGISFAIILEHLDKTLREDQDIEAYLGLPVLGYIPKITDKMVEKVEYVNFEIADESDGVIQEITSLRTQVDQEKKKLLKNEVMDEITEIVEQLNVTLKNIADQEIAFSKLVDFAVQGIFTAEVIAVKKQEIAAKIELLKEEQEELTSKLKNISIVSVESKLQKVLDVIEEFEDLEIAASVSHDANERIKSFVRKVEEVNTI
ncbi:YveK family protein [Neobacillus sp. K501]